jgi:hypothetical protein
MPAMMKKSPARTAVGFIDSGLLKKAKKRGRKVPRIAMVFATKELDDNWARLLNK